MRITKKIAAVVGAAALSLGLAACGGDSDNSDTSGDGSTTKLVVGASPVPHAEILTFVKDNLAKDAGIDLEIKEFTDYIQPNTALHEGDLDANYFQHVPYLEDQIKERGYEFEHGPGIHLEPLGLFSAKDGIKDVSEIKEGDTIGIINDPSNQARGLRVLNDAGLLKLPDDKDYSVAQIAADDSLNPKKLVFKEIEGPQLVRVLDDVTAAVINGNFVVTSGVEMNQLAVESAADNPNSNVLVWRADTDKADAIKKLDDLLRSQEVKDFIAKQWPDKEVIPAE